MRLFKKYKMPTSEPTVSRGDPELIRAISDHVTSKIGPIDQVLHDKDSRAVHVDIHHVAPTEDQPFHILVTSGMSELPMNVPKEEKGFPAAELMAFLPPEADWQKHWMVDQLRFLARVPHILHSFFAPGHTIPNLNPPRPYSAHTKLMCMMFLPAGPLLKDEKAAVYIHPHVGAGMILQCVPIYEREMTFSIAHGTPALTHWLADNVGVPNFYVVHDDRKGME